MRFKPYCLPSCSENEGTEFSMMNCDSLSPVIYGPCPRSVHLQPPRKEFCSLSIPIDLPLKGLVQLDQAHHMDYAGIDRKIKFNALTKDDQMWRMVWAKDSNRIRW